MITFFLGVTSCSLLVASVPEESAGPIFKLEHASYPDEGGSWLIQNTDNYSQCFWTWQFSTECTVHCFEYNKWGKGCNVCRGYSKALGSSPSLKQYSFNHYRDIFTILLSMSNPESRYKNTTFVYINYISSDARKP
jgi:hypothetical protein